MIQTLTSYKDLSPLSWLLWVLLIPPLEMDSPLKLALLWQLFSSMEDLVTPNRSDPFMFCDILELNCVLSVGS